MNKLKALVIENEYDIPNEIEGFIKDNKNLFETVEYQTSCLHRPQDVIASLPAADAVIVMSTFMYMDQLEKYVELLSSDKFGKKSYFIHRFLPTLYKWLEDFQDNRTYLYNDLPLLIKNLVKLVTEHEVYHWQEKEDTEKVTDNLWEGSSMLFAEDEERERNQYGYRKIIWDADNRVFNFEGVTLESLNEWSGYNFED